MSEVTKEKEYYKEAFARNKGLITSHLQDKLKNTHVAICGLGGVGEIHAETLARLGVGRFTLADGDRFEIVNINRQMEAAGSTFGKLKGEVLSSTLLDINPYIHIKPLGFLTPENIDSFLEGADFVVDGMDFFEFDTRRTIFKKAYEKGITVITAAPVGFGSSVMTFTKDSMTFDDYFNISDTTPNELALAHFGIGLTPALLQRSYFDPEKVNLKKHSAPSSVLGTLAAADWVGTIICKIVDGKKVETSPVSFHFDPYVAKMKRTYLRFGNRNILQRIKIWYVTRKLQPK